MWTTLICVYVDDDFVYFSYVGDSRLYHVSIADKKITQLTTDHTLSQNKLNQDLVPNLHARSNHVLTRMVGAGNSLNPGFGKSPLQSGDILLICTDGLSDLVSDENILQAVLNNANDMNNCLQYLLELVNNEGARDNITMVMAGLN